MAQLTVGSLFSGIGGLDLGLERAGMKVVWQSEIDPYACRVLQKHWPEVPNHGDIKQIDWSMVERPAVVCGGYPCQPFSQAGRRKGEEDSRHLWPWVRQAISELRPRYAILENVRGHLSLGGTTVIADLAAIGYDAEWRIVSAASVGANHRRDRIIIVAYPNDTGSHRAEINSAEAGQPPFGGFGGRGTNVAYPNSERTQIPSAGGQPTVALSGSNGATRRTAHVADTAQLHSNGSDYYPRISVEPETLSQPGNDGRTRNMANTDSGRFVHAQPTVYPTDGRFPTFAEPAERGWWTTEPDVGRVADGVPHRVDRLRGLGNAVVPQVAEVIGRLVVSHAQHN